MTTATHQDIKTATPQADKPAQPHTHRKHQGRIHRDPALRKRPLRPLEAIPYGQTILTEIDRFRFLTNLQVGELVYRSTLTKDNRPRSDTHYQDPCNRVLADLFDLKLIERIPVFQTHQRTGNLFQAAVNILTRKGAEAVQAACDRADRGETPRWTPDLKRYTSQKIDHELAINDLAIALRRAVDAIGGVVLDWHDDDLLERHKQTTRFGNFTPDGWCVVQMPGGRLCPLFVEVDRGTEVILSGSGSTKDWKTKIERYGDYFAFRYQDDPFYADLGYDPRAMAKPVVLTETTSPERLANMLKATAAAGGYGTYWYTTRQAIFGTPDMKQGVFGAMVGPIWRRMGIEHPVNLRHHFAGTSS